MGHVRSSVFQNGMIRFARKYQDIDNVKLNNPILQQPVAKIA